MASPVVERIAVILKARLERITVANGFNYTVASVLRPPRLGKINPRHLQIVLIQDDPSINAEQTRESGSGTLRGIDQPFNILAFLRPADADATPIETFINTFEADIRKAITNPADLTLWHEFIEPGPTPTRLAVTARFEASQYFPEASGALDGVGIHLIVTYRTPERDPFTPG